MISITNNFTENTHTNKQPLCIKMNRGEARRHSHLPAVAAVTFFFPFLMQMAKKKIYPGDEFMQWGG